MEIRFLTVTFLEEVKAIEMCASLMNTQQFACRITEIYADTQMALEAIEFSQYNPRTVWDCCEILRRFGKRNRISLD